MTPGTRGRLTCSRFSLVPDDANRSTRPTPAAGSSSTDGAAAPVTGPGIGSTVTNILQRLWGQSGAAASAPTSPAGEVPPALPRTQSGNSTADPSRPAASGPQAELSPPTPSHQGAQPNPTSHNYIPGSFVNMRTMSSSNTSGTQSSQSRSASHTPTSRPRSPQPGVDHVESSRAIPNDYRERHRQREEREKDQPV